MPNTSFVALYRVSTARQGQSGLGLEAQQASVRGYVEKAGGRLIAELTEVESGKAGDRTTLHEALRLCRVHNAVLAIAKLDRLSRNVAFVSALMESGVEFVACDFPQANKLTIHLLVAIAEHEREAISTRTKDALAVAKRRGIKLGGDRAGTFAAARAKGNPASAAVRTAKANRRASDLAPVVASLREQGMSFRAVAREMTARGIPTPRKGAWSAVQVQRVLDRAGIPKPTATASNALGIPASVEA